MEDYSQDTIQQREIHSVTEINQTASDFLNEAFPPIWAVSYTHLPSPRDSCASRMPSSA